MEQKIKSVLDLSKHKVGDVLYWVTFRPVGLPSIPIASGDEWMARCHPKVLYDRKIASKAWQYRGHVPRLSAVDFQYVVDILTSEPIVERFEVHGVHRSSDTGEFYYSNDSGEWMPESYLYTTAAGARREKKRIKQLFRLWSERMSEDDV